MADDDSAQEKTEEATSRRLQKAREDGQVPRSKELTTTAVLLAGSVGLWAFGGNISLTLMDVLRFNFDLEREAIFETNAMFAHVGRSFGDALWSLLPLFAILLAAAVLAPMALGGFLFSSKAIAPKLNRLDPLAGLKRMFSVRSLVELAKSIGKVAIVVLVALLVLKGFENALLALGRQSLEGAVAQSLHISLWAAILISSATIAVAVIDIPFQIWDHAKKLKMSKQDVKDEMKDTEGKPEVKGRIRQLQREMANQRMMEKVPQADVIITNPTHFSVALKYNPDTMTTPVLVAKGVDHMAMRIREVAKAHKVELVAAPMLARAVYHTTEVDGEIPQGLYLAVAQVLAFVFQLRNWRRNRTQNTKPHLPRNLDVPPEMRFPD